MNETQEAFVNLVLPYAQGASQTTGLEISVILAQWADETGWGTSEHWLVGHNPAGISPGGVVANYPSIFDGVHAWCSTMELPYYTAVRAAVGRQAQALALGASPWAAGHYDNGGGPGSALVDLIDDNSLWLYDAPSPNPQPEPEPQPPQPQPTPEDDMPLAAAYDPVQGRMRVFASDKFGDLIERTEAEPGKWWWSNVDALMQNGTPPSIEATIPESSGTHQYQDPPAGSPAEPPPAAAPASP